MEFEKAIYRVYEKCLDSIRDESSPNPNQPSRSCRICEYLLIWLFLFYGVIFVCLHNTFVGNPGCLPQLLQEANYSLPLTKDTILQINIDEAYLEDDMDLNDDTMEDSSDENDRGRRLLRKMNVPTSNWLQSNTSSTNSTITNSSIHDIKYPKYDYEFAFDNAVVGLPDEVRYGHGFHLLNVSMMSSNCFGSHVLIQNMIPLGGVDIVVMNAIKYTVNHSGTMTTARDDYYTWTSSDYTPYKNFAQYLQYKTNVLFGSLFSFFAISTLTALLVRVLISSGVVILFPLFWGLQVTHFHTVLGFTFHTRCSDTKEFSIPGRSLIPTPGWGSPWR